MGIFLFSRKVIFVDVDLLVASRLKQLRVDRALSLATLSELTGVSKAMISKIERKESSPTANILGRLAAGLEISLSQLFAEDAPVGNALRKRASQPVWSDVGTGLTRRQVFASDSDYAFEIVEIVLPEGSPVAYPAWGGNSYKQVLWLVEGHLVVTYGDELHDMKVGDCLTFAVDKAVSFQAIKKKSCRYLLVSEKK
jgi:transcriptional regulator with XRE-family HTH domain